MATNFAIDAGTMTNQPSNISVEPAEGEYHETIDGGFVVSPKAKGAVISVTWGVEALKTAAMAELRTARGSTYSHTISWTDPSSVAQSYDVLIPPIPHEILNSELYGKFTLKMRERP